MKTASNKSFGYNEEEIVSSDVIGTGFGSLFDATQTLVLREDAGSGDLWQVQVVSWYDNESSYASQMVRTVKYFAALKAAPGKTAKPGASGAKTTAAKSGASTAKTATPKSAADKNREKQNKAPLPRKPLINFPK
jgi:hypothetical protein